MIWARLILCLSWENRWTLAAAGMSADPAVTGASGLHALTLRKYTRKLADLYFVSFWLLPTFSFYFLSFLPVLSKIFSLTATPSSSSSFSSLTVSCLLLSSCAAVCSLPLCQPTFGTRSRSESVNTCQTDAVHGQGSSLTPKCLDRVFTLVTWKNKLILVGECRLFLWVGDERGSTFLHLAALSQVSAPSSPQRFTTVLCWHRAEKDWK